VFNQKDFNSKLLEYVIHTNQPLTLVRNKCFVELIHSSNPYTNIICYETIKNLIHDKIEEKKNYQKCGNKIQTRKGRKNR
jgi:hypothetical protein